MSETYLFTWPAGPKQVYITGKFDNWSKSTSLTFNQADNQWEVVLPIQWDEEGVFPFKFVVDGKWVLSDEYKAERDSVGNENNYIIGNDLIKQAETAELKRDDTASLNEELKAAMQMRDVINKDIEQSGETRDPRYDSADQNDEDEVVDEAVTASELELVNVDTTKDVSDVDLTPTDVSVPKDSLSEEDESEIGQEEKNERAAPQVAESEPVIEIGTFNETMENKPIEEAIEKHEHIPVIIKDPIIKEPIENEPIENLIPSDNNNNLETTKTEVRAVENGNASKVATEGNDHDSITEPTVADHKDVSSDDVFIAEKPIIGNSTSNEGAEVDKDIIPDSAEGTKPEEFEKRRKFKIKKKIRRHKKTNVKEVISQEVYEYDENDNIIGKYSSMDEALNHQNNQEPSNQEGANEGTMSEEASRSQSRLYEIQSEHSDARSSNSELETDDLEKEKVKVAPSEAEKAKKEKVKKSKQQPKEEKHSVKDVKIEKTKEKKIDKVKPKRATSKKEKKVKEDEVNSKVTKAKSAKEKTTSKAGTKSTADKKKATTTTNSAKKPAGAKTTSKTTEQEDGIFSKLKKTFW